MKGPIETVNTNDYGTHRQPSTNGNENDFSEFMWMADEELEEFDRKYYEELLIEECFEEFLLMEDDDAWMNEAVSQSSNGVSVSNCSGGQTNGQASSSQQVAADLAASMQSLSVQPTQPPRVPKAQLNPNAPVFIPRSAQTATTLTAQ